MSRKDSNEPDVATEAPSLARSLLHPRAASGRLMIAAVVGCFATFMTPMALPIHVRAMVGWDAGALTFLALAWVMIMRADGTATRQRAAAEDPGRNIVFAIAVTASAFSLVAAVSVLRAVRNLPPQQASIWSGLAIAAVVLSWFVTHTAYTLRYAHLYYEHGGSKGCIHFEGTEEPSDLDFAYFAFTLGMCFQTSDVTIASSAARRTALVHSLLSFGYNTTILALSLNIVTTLLG